MDSLRHNEFIFSPRYRLWRHIVFWFAYTILTGLPFVLGSQGLWTAQRMILLGFLWLPARMLYCYPLMYWIVPKFLLKGKYLVFGLIIIAWFVIGIFINVLYRTYVFIPLQEAMGMQNIVKATGSPGSFLLLTTAAGVTCMIVLFKYWYVKQQQWLQSEKEKITAELQLLKAQIHPHFLFNTLNNIYSFALENSPRTPDLILKLSSLLSYMLYDCKAEKVFLEKELEIMKNYIDLEKERYGNKIEISWNNEGDIRDKYIAPLLMLPFLENAFKHGTSDQLEKPWLSVDISVKQDILRCKIVNSKNEGIPLSENGIGINNVYKRLAYLYPGKHELKLNDEPGFFVVSLSLELKQGIKEIPKRSLNPVMAKSIEA